MSIQYNTEEIAHMLNSCICGIVSGVNKQGKGRLQFQAFGKGSILVFIFSE